MLQRDWKFEIVITCEELADALGVRAGWRAVTI